VVKIFYVSFSILSN